MWSKLYVFLVIFTLATLFVPGQAQHTENNILDDEKAARAVSWATMGLGAISMLLLLMDKHTFNGYNAIST